MTVTPQDRSSETLLLGSSETSTNDGAWTLVPEWVWEVDEGSARFTTTVREAVTLAVAARADRSFP